MITEDIAIIGLDISLPHCPGHQDTWGFLKNKRVSVGRFPEKRIRQTGLLANEEQFFEGSYFDSIDTFDHKFFNISQKSAEYMDPNQRMSLLSATRALNDSGYLKKIRGTKTGVYGSVNTTQQYQYQLLLQKHELTPDLLGILNSTISSRINYVFNLNGPSLMTDTACSSSLVSVIQACNDLRNGTVNSAIAVSSNLYVKPGFKEEKLVDILSGDSRTRAFDERSTGASMGEGVCSVILKRRSDAERDGDHIYGIIKNYAMNNDGQTMNMSSPNPMAQENLLEEAWAPLCSQLGNLAFIEAHGTGTAIGDTIEFESLNNYFLSHDMFRQSVALNSCKSNFGHLDVASGLFSLIKSVLSLKYQTILPHPDFKIPNEEIDFEESVFFIPDKAHDIEPHSYAGISSFGMTGTNAHVVLEGISMERPSPDLPLNLDLRSYWFPQLSNSFALKNSLQKIEDDRTLIIQYPLHIQKNWEIREHKFNKKHLMVGTGFFEILSQGLSRTSYNLVTYDVKNLQILNQLTIEQGAFTVVLSLDKHSLSGKISFTAGEVIKNWLQFDLVPASRSNAGESFGHHANSFEEIEVTNQVGESDEEIEVSKRWDVIDSLWVNQEQTKALVKLKVPESFEKEFELYDYYPSILDPAFNAWNRLAEPDSILFPWLWKEIQFAEGSLKGDEFFSEIELKERIGDDTGNIILSYDIRLYDLYDNLILSVKDYKVKNSLSQREEQTIFHQEKFHASQFKEKKSHRNLVIIHESLRGDVRVEGNVRYFKNISEILDLDSGSNLWEHVYFWDKNYTDFETIASETYELGKLLLHMNKMNIKKFHYINTGIFGYDSMNPLNRSAAMGLYSLRLEMNFPVTVIDTAVQSDAENIIHTDFGNEDFIVSRNPSYYIIRFKSLKIPADTAAKLDGRTVLVIGGGSGIGLEYTKYLTEKFPDSIVMAAGRRTVTPAKLPSKVEYITLDIGDEESVRTFAQGSGKNVDYILNFAGEPAKGLFVNKAISEFCEKTKSKITGSYLLQKYFSFTEEIIHFSSLAGVIGALGQAEYCAGNACQSGLAHSENQVRTLNLTGWMDVGMSANQHDPYFEKLNSDEGVKLLDVFVQSDIPHASMFKTKQEAENYSSILSKIVKAENSKPHLSRHASAGEKGSPGQMVLNVWKRVLGDDEYDPSISFFEQGGDSITIVQLCDELNKVFPETFDVSTLFSTPTIQEQIDYVEDSKSQRNVVEKAISIDAKDIYDFLYK
ncbi:Polyketide synthase dehydratase [Bacillus sp. OV322]|uniref:SDR family NAD(P)-dependent oxidoreductase n=1 Tax=Bacillus sp. OV322 TaxID=1882764 RepID=UPI0008F32074|nr:SDR family NAD(P)-dependent oxidoreductase [Bacillus sp. OV322]SFC55737.1 Polyketide synthase dehydratase [Bacillus sp. OV322]